MTKCVMMKYFDALARKDKFKTIGNRRRRAWLGHTLHHNDLSHVLVEERVGQRLRRRSNRGDFDRKSRGSCLNQ